MLSNRISVVRLCAVTAISGTLFLAYWLTTLLYVMPDTPLRDSVSGPLEVFEKYAYQKWTFFAPPPEFNDKLVITYTDRLTLLSTNFDPLSDLLANKRNAGVFNIGQEAMDYLISGAVDQVSHMATLGKHQKSKLSIDSELNFPGLNTLKRYATIVAQSHNLPVDEQVVVIADYAEFIPEISPDGKVLPGKTTLRFVTTPFRLDQ